MNDAERVLVEPGYVEGLSLRIPPGTGRIVEEAAPAASERRFACGFDLMPGLGHARFAGRTLRPRVALIAFGTRASLSTGRAALAPADGRLEAQARFARLGVDH